MPDDGPWTTHATEIVYATPRLRVYRDDVERPDGKADRYDWVEVRDQVRVAALVGDALFLIDQHHYLLGRTLQLPGGEVDHQERDHDAARRELREETGYRAASWFRHGELFALPGLSRARVHLWSAGDLIAGEPQPEPAEADLRVVQMPLGLAVDAVRNGGVRCAASAALILLVSHIWRDRSGRDDARPVDR